MRMELSSSLACVLATLFVLGLVRADVGVAQQQQQQQQRLRLQQLSYPAAGFKPARQFPLPAQPQSERLVANSEAQEDLDDAAEEVTTRPKIAAPVPAPAPVPVPVPAAAPFTPTIAYYPAGAVGFVHPTTYAKVLGAPPAAYGNLIAAPQLPQAAYAKVLAAPQQAAFAKLLAAPQLQPQATAAYVNAPQYYAAYFG
ncbi:translation initiation factor IF-2 [Drosophila subobscura]|uniref:translation initiation factor IF-2 n=1 Tax=Drosophila subobscura TaxID=7241 RepID=UPI00155B2F24|nr:translation initiation factor IF-2 [Drosophila subobscura]